MQIFSFIPYLLALPSLARCSDNDGGENPLGPLIVESSHSRFVTAKARFNQTFVEHVDAALRGPYRLAERAANFSRASLDRNKLRDEDLLELVEYKFADIVSNLAQDAKKAEQEARGMMRPIAIGLYRGMDWMCQLVQYEEREVAMGTETRAVYLQDKADMERMGNQTIDAQNVAETCLKIIPSLEKWMAGDLPFDPLGYISTLRNYRRMNDEWEAWQHDILDRVHAVHDVAAASEPKSKEAILQLATSKAYVQLQVDVAILSTFAKMVSFGLKLMSVPGSLVFNWKEDGSAEPSLVWHWDDQEDDEYGHSYFLASLADGNGTTWQAVLNTAVEVSMGETGRLKDNENTTDSENDQTSTIATITTVVLAPTSEAKV